MPKIDKIFSLEITPEQFLENCSDHELLELDLLIQMPRYSHRIVQVQNSKNDREFHSNKANKSQINEQKDTSPENEDKKLLEKGF